MWMTLQPLTLMLTVSLGEFADPHPRPHSSLRHQHHHAFSKNSLISGWPFPWINMVTTGPEVLKVLCGLIKVCCMLGWGRAETTVQALETLPVQSRWLCAPQRQTTSACDDWGCASEKPHPGTVQSRLQFQGRE